MFCPNCGNNCGDANFCPNCGCNLKGTVITVSTADNVPDERTEMIQRYEKYMPNKLAAIKALREDTGMGLKEAKEIIDELFGENQKSSYPSASDLDQLSWYPGKKKADRRSKIEELEASGQVYCPKCLSTSVSANKKGFGFVRGALGAYIGLDVGLITGGIGSKKVICTCLKCGYQWKPGKK